MEYFYYFGLKGEPFRPASPDGAVYFSPTHLEGLATLEAGLSGQLNGLSLLTGEAGPEKPPSYIPCCSAISSASGSRTSTTPSCRFWK